MMKKVYTECGGNLVELAIDLPDGLAGVVIAIDGVEYELNTIWEGEEDIIFADKIEIA